MSHKMIHKAYTVKLTAVIMLVIMLVLLSITLCNLVGWFKGIEYVRSNVHGVVNRSLTVLAVSVRFGTTITLINVVITVIMLVVLEGALSGIADSIIHLVKVSSPAEYDAVVLAEERERRFYRWVKWVMLGSTVALCAVAIALSVMALKG